MEFYGQLQSGAFASAGKSPPGIPLCRKRLFGDSLRTQIPSPCPLRGQDAIPEVVSRKRAKLKPTHTSLWPADRPRHTRSQAGNGAGMPGRAGDVQVDVVGQPESRECFLPANPQVSAALGLRLIEASSRASLPLAARAQLQPLLPARTRKAKRVRSRAGPAHSLCAPNCEACAFLEQSSAGGEDVSCRPLARHAQLACRRMAGLAVEWARAQARILRTLIPILVWLGAELDTAAHLSHSF